MRIEGVRDGRRRYRWLTVLATLLLVLRAARADDPPAPAASFQPDSAEPWSEMAQGLGTEPAPLETPADGWLDNLSIHGGLDGSKGPEDLGVSANFGGRFAVNVGFPIAPALGLGGQLGSALNYARSATTVLETSNGIVERTQSFTTAGLFQRTDSGFLWAFVYDFLYEQYYADMWMGQWRLQCGYCMSDSDEMGMWGGIGDFGDRATLAGFALGMMPISQGNVYWKHHWASGGVTSFWAGMADGHGRFVLVNPGAPPIQHPFVFGANLYIPLNYHLALFGEASFITPNDTGTVTAYLGFAFTPGGGAWTASQNRFAPAFNVANNPTFAVDVRP